MGLFYATKPLEIVDSPADAKHYSPGRNHTPRVIFLHHTGGSDSLAWLTRTSVPPVSAHRLILRDGTIHKLVQDWDTAYTQGFATMGPYSEHGTINCNDIGLSIELENLGNGLETYPSAQLRSCALQIHEWWGNFGYLPILPHYMVDSRKADPRAFPMVKLNQLLLGLQRDLRIN